MKNNPVVVFVADEKRSEKFMTATNFHVLPADTFRDALAHVIFSYPDSIVIDASKDVLRAEDTFFHLRTINHPPIIILSNVEERWDRQGKNPVIVLPTNSSPQDIEQAIQATLTGDMTAIY